MSNVYAKIREQSKENRWHGSRPSNGMSERQRFGIDSICYLSSKHNADSDTLSKKECLMGTSKLQRLVSSTLNEHFRSLEIRENTRPDWCISERGERLELDFYLPEIDVAVEVQGGQHFTYTPVFHATYQDFEAQQKRDESKKALCKRYGVMLLEIEEESALTSLIEGIQSIHRARLERIRKEISLRKFRALPVKIETLNKRTKATVAQRNTLRIHDYQEKVVSLKKHYETLFAEYGQYAISMLPEHVGYCLINNYLQITREVRYAEKQWYKHQRNTGKLGKLRKNGGTL